MVLSEPEITEKLKKIGNVARPSSPEELKAHIVADIARWKSIVSEAHIARI
jgi:tripartite-type tricarboxylate transporter receptor subunit TctC